MVAYEAKRFAPGQFRLAGDAVHLAMEVKMGLSLILHHQAVGTEKEEYRHAIVAEERQQMDGQEDVGMDHDAVEPVDIALEKLVFVLFDYRAEPVAVVVHEDADDGKSAQRIAGLSGQYRLIHLLFPFSSYSFLLCSSRSLS